VSHYYNEISVLIEMSSYDVTHMQLVVEHSIQIIGIAVKSTILKKFIPYIQLRNLHHIQLSVSKTSAQVLYFIQKQLLDTFWSLCVPVLCWTPQNWQLLYQNNITFFKVITFHCNIHCGTICTYQNVFQGDKIPE
jgi:hypothetical protein